MTLSVWLSSQSGGGDNDDDQASTLWTEEEKNKMIAEILVENISLFTKRLHGIM